MSVQAYSQDLQVLVHELSKTNPNEKVIKNKTDLLGIPYSPDLIILMSEVLVFLSKTESKKSRYKEKAI
jgi:hypothetical protein